MTDLIRKPLVTLFLLVVLNIVLLSVQIRSESGRTLLRSWSLAIITPFAWGLDALSDGVRSVFDRYLLLYGAEQENRQLREENQRLRLEVTQLRNLQEFFDRVPDYELVRRNLTFSTRPAAVIWKSPPFHSQRLFINAGTRDGVVKDAAVIAPRGIVGRVLGTTPFSSEVELITNAGAAVGAVLDDSRLEGVIQGDGTARLVCNYIPSYEEADVGQTIYTSGTDRIYPRGVPIGRIVRSTKGTRVYREIQVEPLVDFVRVEEVLVVTRSN